ncbi:MAG TPA: orotate phosphoribosyltransferase [Verrucomicrobiae bacterium]|nr:orotate phosphoribosyltransferase [Verrucomicrobiae bacterium]
MTTPSRPKERLLALLKKQSVFHGDFVLSSGARSNVYVDCKLTTLDPTGACLAGEVMFSLIRDYAKEHGLKLDAVGGLTMGADPLALAIGIESVRSEHGPRLQVFSVRKSPKAHGQNKLIEGNFQPGNRVVVLDDVITRGESTLKAIEAVEQSGGHVDLVVALVDREEGGRQKIVERRYPVLSVFGRKEVFERESADAPKGSVAIA